MIINLFCLLLSYNLYAADTTTYFDPKFIEYVLTQDNFSDASQDELDKVRECLAVQAGLAEKNRAENQGVLECERKCFACALPTISTSLGGLLPVLYPQIFTLRATSGCLIGGCISIPCCVAGIYYAHYQEFQELNRIKAQIATYNAEVHSRNAKIMSE